MYGIVPFEKSDKYDITVMEKMLKAGDVAIHRWNEYTGSNLEPLGV